MTTSNGAGSNSLASGMTTSGSATSGATTSDVSPMNTLADVLQRLQEQGSEKDRQGMARFGINVARAYGVSIGTLRGIAKELGTNDELAKELWATGRHEARILASMIAEPARMSSPLMEDWVRELDSWDSTDQLCNNLFRKTVHAVLKAEEWAGRPEEFVKRAGFSLMAVLAVHEKQAPDALFESFLVIIRREADDERNFVRKAASWALRQIGKRSEYLRARAVETANSLSEGKKNGGAWVARQALGKLEAR